MYAALTPSTPLTTGSKGFTTPPNIVLKNSLGPLNIKFSLLSLLGSKDLGHPSTVALSLRFNLPSYLY